MTAGARRLIVLVMVLVGAVLGGAAPGTPAALADEFDFGNPAFCAPEEPARNFGISSLPPGA